MSKKTKILKQIAESLKSLEKMTLAKNQAGQIADTDFEDADAYVWQAERSSFHPVPEINHLPLTLLAAIGDKKEILLENTEAFAKGYPANNALLWGARGMGKSSLVKAVFVHLCQMMKKCPLKLIEVHREDLGDLPTLLRVMASRRFRFIIFCDDLSFEREDSTYKSLKAILEGGIEGRPDNVIFYATSNRRHLLPRTIMENERGSALNPGDVVNEKISLSDRFGLWIGFHNCSPQEFETMVQRYGAYFQVPLPEPELLKRANLWSIARGSRSGRVAWQFIQSLMAELSISPEASASPKKKGR